MKLLTSIFPIEFMHLKIEFFSDAPELKTVDDALLVRLVTTAMTIVAKAVRPIMIRNALRFMLLFFALKMTMFI
jgi:hypothetical protein